MASESLHRNTPLRLDDELANLRLSSSSRTPTSLFLINFIPLHFLPSVVWGYALLPPVDIAQIADSGDEVLGTTTFHSTIARLLTRMIECYKKWSFGGSKMLW